MTQLTETLFSTIVHDFHNGGVKSSYGLDTYTRKEVLTYLIRSKGCECINCIQLLHVTPMLYNKTNLLTKEEHNMTIKYSIWQGSRLLSIDNVAHEIKAIDHLINSLNDSDLGKKTKFTANIQEIKVGN